jgi:hypothetical protein
VSNDNTRRINPAKPRLRSQKLKIGKSTKEKARAFPGENVTLSRKSHLFRAAAEITAIPLILKQRDWNESIAEANK